MIVIPPILIGKMHGQKTSVTGFMILLLQIASAPPGRSSRSPQEKHGGFF